MLPALSFCCEFIFFSFIFMYPIINPIFRATWASICCWVLFYSNTVLLVFLCFCPQVFFFLSFFFLFLFLLLLFGLLLYFPSFVIYIGIFFYWFLFHVRSCFCFSIERHFGFWVCREDDIFCPIISRRPLFLF